MEQSIQLGLLLAQTEDARHRTRVNVAIDAAGAEDQRRNEHGPHDDVGEKARMLHRCPGGSRALGEAP